MSRIREIEKDIEKLSRFKDLSLQDFKTDDNFAIAEHYLRRALEAVFDIGNHILSRVPEAVPETFAKEKLIKMAGYRNRLIHF